MEANWLKVTNTVTNEWLAWENMQIPGDALWPFSATRQCIIAPFNVSTIQWNRIVTSKLQPFEIKTGTLASHWRIFILFVREQGVLMFDWPQYALWMHSHGHGYATHMNALRKKALWHILTYAGLETVLNSQSEMQRQRHTAGEREGILTRCSQLHSIHHITTSTNYFLKYSILHFFKHCGHQWKRNFVWSYSKIQLYRCKMFCVHGGKTCLSVSLLSCVLVCFDGMFDICCAM